MVGVYKYTIYVYIPYIYVCTYIYTYAYTLIYVFFFYVFFIPQLSIDVVLSFLPTRTHTHAQTHPMIGVSGALGLPGGLLIVDFSTNRSKCSLRTGLLVYLH